jgi:ABC-2 type transport system permease protein
MSAQSKAVNQDLILAARQGLLPVRARAWLGGLGNLLRKELGQWWGTRTWWVQTLIWVLVLNGISTIVMLTDNLGPEALLDSAVQTFLPMSVGIVGIGTVISVQGAIVGEKQLGTAAWVISKPVSRSAFILAKILAYASGFFVTAILIPSVIFFFATRALISVPLSVLPYLYGVGVVIVGQLFYLTLTVMLGTFFNSRGPIAGIGIGIIMFGLLLRSLVPMPVLLATPWPLPEIAGGLALGASLPAVWPLPVLASGLAIVVMTAVALWRFQREEF